MSEHTRKSGFWFSAVLVVIVVAVGLLVGSGVGSADDDGDEAPPVTEPSAAEDARECPDTWLIVQVDHEQNNRHRFYDAGLREIYEADTDEEAREAAHTWLGLVRRDPEYFAGGAVSYFLHRQVDPATLVDAEGKCASALAEQLLAELETQFALSRITPSEAPENGYNSGVNDGNVVGASNPGISGDRTAVLIESPTGDKVWIMARCGNPVTEGTPPVPPGDTDEPPPTTTTTVPDDTTTSTTAPPTTTTTVPTTTTTKPPTSWDCQQNGTGPNCPFPPVQQPPQHNPDQPVGPTPGAPPAPHVPPPGPPPVVDTPAPPPNDGGYDSGSPDGSGTPGGSTCDSSGCTGGGPTPPASGPPPVVEPDPDPIGGDPGGF